MRQCQRWLWYRLAKGRPAQRSPPADLPPPREFLLGRRKVPSRFHHSLLLNRCFHALPLPLLLLAPAILYPIPPHLLASSSFFLLCSLLLPSFLRSSVIYYIFPP